MRLDTYGALSFLGGGGSLLACLQLPKPWGAVVTVVVALVLQGCQRRVRP